MKILFICLITYLALSPSWALQLLLAFDLNFLNYYPVILRSLCLSNGKEWGSRSANIGRFNPARLEATFFLAVSAGTFVLLSLEKASHPLQTLPPQPLPRLERARESLGLLQADLTVQRRTQENNLPLSISPERRRSLRPGIVSESPFSQSACSTCSTTPSWETRFQMTPEPTLRALLGRWGAILDNLTPKFLWRKSQSGLSFSRGIYPTTT